MSDIGEVVWKNWPEFLALALLIMGFSFAISLQSAILIYLVVILSGLLAGRYYFSKIGKQPLFPFFLIIIGLLLGYIIGSFNANRIAVAILFIIAWITSHQLHKKGYIPV